MTVFFLDNLRSEVVIDAISGVAVRRVCADIHVKCGDAASYRSRDIPPAHFVMDDDERRRRRTQVIT